MKHPLLSLAIAVLFIAMPALAHKEGHSSEPALSAQAAREQARSRQQTAGSRGSIRGRIVSSEGQPLINASVFVVVVGAQTGTRSTISTNERGEFQADDLPPAIYNVIATVPGYVDSNFPGSPESSRYYRLGDTVSITMVRGGVITGAVTGADGKPVVAVGVRAVQVRDVDGQHLRTPRAVRSAESDDRGIYRIYGLAPGSYVVVANKSAFVNNSTSPYAEDAPTYFPSATRDTATEITVLSGHEVTGIDIRYLGEKGHAISGTISGALPAARSGGVSVAMINTATNATEANAFISSLENKNSFAFYGVPDGEYEIFAQGFSSAGDNTVSLPRRVSVKGSDVTGIELSLAPLGSISGRIVVERQRGPSMIADCKAKRAMMLEENLVSARLDDKSGGERRRSPFSPRSFVIAPDEQGEFTARRVAAGRYRFGAVELNESFYIKSVTLAASNKSSPPADVSLNGVSVRSGGKVTGLTITVAEGAAGIEGRLVQAADSKQLPRGLRAILVPAESENRDNLLRYGEVALRSDGSFKLNNIAPGRYWLLAKQDERAEQAGEPSAPFIWDARSRAAIRREAEQANAVVELKTCRKITDYPLSFVDPSKKTETRPARRNTNGGKER
jgi:hypothetical protein